MKFRMSLGFSMVALLFTAWPARGEDKSGAPARGGELYRQLFKERLKNIERLRHYRENGVFPRNYDFPGKMVPYFVDVHGTHCAVAHLVKESGASDLVSQVVKLDNNIYVNDVKDGPFLDWIHRSGLTQEECARIQPSYNFYKPSPEEQERKRIQEHLARVESELRANSFPSLGKAMAILKDRYGNPDMDFVVVPPQEKTEKTTIFLEYRNEPSRHTPTPLSISLSWLFFNDKGEIVKGEVVDKEKKGLRNKNSQKLTLGKSSELTYDKDIWAFVAWKVEGGKKGTLKPVDPKNPGKGWKLVWGN